MRAFALRMALRWKAVRMAVFEDAVALEKIPPAAVLWSRSGLDRVYVRSVCP
jgi:hypothetical protein